MIQSYQDTKRFLKSLLQQNESFCLLGHKGVGKSHLVYQILDERTDTFHYINSFGIQ